MSINAVYVELWVIHNSKEGYWNNHFGWGDYKELATKFTVDKKDTVNLPIVPEDSVTKWEKW